MQTYVGASVMSGHICGVQTLMHQQYPFAYFVHCAAHSLNLVLSQAVSSIWLVKVFFLLMLVILVLFQPAAHIEKLSSWLTTLRFPPWVKPDGTIELVPSMSSSRIANIFMIFWKRLMIIRLGGMMILEV